MPMTYRPPEDLAELLRVEAFRRRTTQTDIINKALRDYLAGSHAPGDLPKPPKKWKAPDENEAFRENLEKVHTDRDAEAQTVSGRNRRAARLVEDKRRTERAEIAPEVFEDPEPVVPAARPAPAVDQVKQPRLVADKPGDSACPKCAFPIRSGKCTNKYCTGKAKS